MNFLEQLDMRKSIRHFDSTHTISDDEILSILNHASNAPSNNNAQPWKVVVIKDKQLLVEMQKLSFNQEQVGQSSAVFLILGDRRSYEIDRLVQLNLKYHLITETEINDKKQRIKTYFSLHPEDEEEVGLRFDVGLFSMNLMHVLRTFGYDSVPMRGVDFEKMMQVLKLPDEWDPILVLPVGKATTIGHSHQRESAEKFTTIIK
ncbi:nitroreductase family protein [Leuconostoc gelidum]|uniref:nitroreductase family protein n=1 Tax=Leuconostoc gelidum TaxID=1244 RepID=UPI0002193CED|nr:nitroreductase family protein [Leuconostoc gelidum]AFS40444.1 putative NADH dehydrogenase; NAD(P)H nitroreductase [Leuconostoc gelidum JB7]MBZ5978382.1 nitroreductase family protein [Leuconostoc gelidum subsp. gelidum]MBZ5992702.1 nitroreductase family protein [Leuconostoc gelidum subsp. gelidum]USP16379.1 nitroreductase family protein [Leuconostoc gelidum subsp. aenigmaticum]GMA68201.1 NADH dehydrogenase [Leuconostoc gelidum subsp. gelidum]